MQCHTSLTIVSAAHPKFWYGIFFSLHSLQNEFKFPLWLCPWPMVYLEWFCLLSKHWGIFSDLSLFLLCGFMFCRQKTHFVRLRYLTFIETCFVQCYGPCWWMCLVHLKWMCVFPVWAICKYQLEHIGCWGCSSLPYPYWCPGNLFIQFLKY